MRRFLQGFVIGAILATVATAWAASRIVLVDGSGTELGTASNPIYAQSV